MSRKHFSDYSQETTERCARALLTLLGDIGPWRERIYLAGGLAPRYLTGTLPEGARQHVGTTDVASSGDTDAPCFEPPICRPGPAPTEAEILKDAVLNRLAERTL